MAIDKLAKLEAQILKYYLAKGYKLYKDQNESDPKWDFSIEILSDYKSKEINVYFSCNSEVSIAFSCREFNTEKMFNKAFDFFKA
jgi:hypothetical protein